MTHSSLLRSEEVMARVRPIPFSAPMVRAILREIAEPGTGKTMTRRTIKPRRHASLFDGTWTDAYVLNPGNAEWRDEEVRYRVGDLLWCREAWQTVAAFDHLNATQIAERCLEDGYKQPWASILYRADGERRGSAVEWYTVGIGCGGDPGRQRVGRFMPCWASRITLEVTGVKVERLQNISDDDAIAEGVYETAFYEDAAFRAIAGAPWSAEQLAFTDLWNSINPQQVPVYDEDGRKIGMEPNPARWEANPLVAAITFRPHLANVDDLLRQWEGWR
jgi:hypothetical protein